MPKFKKENKDTTIKKEIWDTKHAINGHGKYFNSKYMNSKLGYFGKSRRLNFKDFKNIPGPGTYIMPSDFGIY